MLSPYSQITSPPQAGAEVLVNNMGLTLAHAAVYGFSKTGSTGLVRRYYGGRWGGFDVGTGTPPVVEHTFADNDTTYVSVEYATGDMDFDTDDTNYLDTANYARVEIVPAVTGTINQADVIDDRAGPGGTGGSAVVGTGDMLLGTSQTVTADKTFADGTLKLGGSTSGAATLHAPAVAGTFSYTFPAASGTLLYSGGALGTPASGNLSGCTADGTNAVGFRTLPVNSQSGNYTTVLTDVGKSIRHPSGGGAGDTFTIDSQANVAWPDGAAITFENRDSNALLIAITTDTLRWTTGGGTGTRTLAQYGIATAVFDDAINEWLISGSNLT